MSQGQSQRLLHARDLPAVLSRSCKVSLLSPSGPLLRGERMLISRISYVTPIPDELDSADAAVKPPFPPSRCPTC